MEKEKLKKQTNFNTQKLKNNKAITLIALVVTIVVLLILAGISISLVVGDNGLIRKSKDAKKQYEEAQANELAMTDEAGDFIDETVTGVAKPAKIPVGTKANKNGTIDGKEGNANNPTIPKNYTPIDAGEATWGDGTSSPTQNAVDHGLVIKDDSGNEWVWIPVDSATLGKMVETSTEAKTLCGTTGDTAVTTNKYSKTITIGKDSDTETILRTTPGTTNCREPDLVVGSGTYCDAQDTNYKIILGETGTKEQLAKLFAAEYNEMITSISKYGGFYIGRYELSGTVTEPTEKSGKTLTSTDWYNLYNACRSSKLQASDKVKTQMIWGCQWDVTMNWLISSGAKTSDEVNKDSSSWGNYKDYNTANNYTAGTAGYEKNAGSKRNTGSSENWKANNIYDLAGNCYECTQEAYGTDCRANRGGGYNGNGSGNPASDRFVFSPGSSSFDYFRFSSHFNNKVAQNARA